MKKVIVIIGVLILLITSVLAFPYVYNNCVLYNIERDLKNADLGSDVVILDSKSVCGKLNGNGNGMNFFAAVLIESDLSVAEVEANLATLKEKYEMVEVAEASSTTIQSVYLEHATIVFDQSFFDGNDETLMVVYAYESSGGIMIGDIRAH